MFPPISTQRLILRHLEKADWPAYRDMMATDHAKFMGGPYDTAGAWGMFCSDHAQWDFHGAGAVMIETKASGEVVGQVGLNASPLFPETEIGWFLYPEFEGQGYALEAALALRDWAFEHRDLKTLVSYILPENLRSIALVKKMGAVLDSKATPLTPSGLVYRHSG